MDSQWVELFRARQAAWGAAGPARLGEADQDLPSFFTVFLSVKEAPQHVGPLKRPMSECSLREVSGDAVGRAV